MIVTGAWAASRMAACVLPAAVGPQITRMASPCAASPAPLLPAKAALELGPRELHDGGAAVHVVRGQARLAECDEERAHLALRELVARLDGRLARDGRREALVPRMRRG